MLQLLNSPLHAQEEWKVEQNHNHWNTLLSNKVWKDIPSRTKYTYTHIFISLPLLQTENHFVSSTISFLSTSKQFYSQLNVLDTALFCRCKEQGSNIKLHSHSHPALVVPQHNSHFLNPTSTAIPGISLLSLHFGPMPLSHSILYQITHPVFHLTVKNLKGVLLDW